MLILVKALAEPIMADRGRAHPSNLALGSDHHWRKSRLGSMLAVSI